MTQEGPVVREIRADQVLGCNQELRLLVTAERVAVPPAAEGEEAGSVVHTSHWHGFPFVLVSEPTMVIVPE